MAAKKDRSRRVKALVPPPAGERAMPRVRRGGPAPSPEPANESGDGLEGGDEK